MSSLRKKRRKKRQVTFLDTKKKVTKRDNNDPISKTLHLIDNEVEKNISNGFTPRYLIFVSSLPERT